MTVTHGQTTKDLHGDGHSHRSQRRDADGAEPGRRRLSCPRPSGRMADVTGYTATVPNDLDDDDERPSIDQITVMATPVEGARLGLITPGTNNQVDLAVGTDNTSSR